MLAHQETKPRPPRGSILIVTLWAMVLLGGVLITLTTSFHSGLDIDMARNGLFRARMLAESGLALARHPLIKAGDPLLVQDMDGGVREAEITSEGVRINMNHTLQREDRELLKALFTRWEIDGFDGSDLVERLLDWVDPDDLERVSGAESGSYQRAGLGGFPKNRPFRDVDEIATVLGWSLVEEKQPRWREYFTTWSTGPVDVNEAPGSLLEIVADITPQQSGLLERIRLGPDGEEFTEDDVKFQSLDEFRMLLGIPLNKFEAIQGRLGTNDAVKRVRSLGRIGKFEVVFNVIMRDEGGARRTLAYTED